MLKSHAMSSSSKHVWLFLALAGIMLSTTLPRLVSLDRYVTPDEHLWVARSANFYYALGQRDFAATYQKQHPGVTVMWAGTAAFLLQYPEYRGSGTGQLEPDEFHYYLTKVRQISPLKLLVTARILLVLAQTLILGAAFLYATQLTGLVPAFIGFLLISFDPFHLGLTRLLHLDGLFSNLVLLSLLSWMVFLVKGGKLPLVVSGLAAGLGWLTKSPALFLIPIFGLILLGKRWKSLIEALRLRSLQSIWRVLGPFAGWLVLGMVIFVLLWPSMWVRPLDTISMMIGKAQDMADAGHNVALFFNGQIYPEGRLGVDLFYFYPVAYGWRASPLVLIGLVLVLPGLKTRLYPFDQPGARNLAYGLLITVALFTLGFTLASKKFDRYLLPVFAPLDLLAGMGWLVVANMLRISSLPGNKMRSFFQPLLSCWIITTLLTGVVVFQAILALHVFPYYLDYYNPMLGGIQKAASIMQIGWGEGLDQAAQYLNQKTNAKDLHVSSWYAAGCFSYFFVGHVRPVTFHPDMSERAWEQFITSDYAVVYAHQWQRQVPVPLLQYVSKLKPEHSVWLNGFEYARIYKIR